MPGQKRRTTCCYPEAISSDSESGSQENSVLAKGREMFSIYSLAVGRSQARRPVTCGLCRYAWTDRRWRGMHFTHMSRTESHSLYDVAILAFIAMSSWRPFTNRAHPLSKKDFKATILIQTLKKTFRLLVHIVSAWGGGTINSLMCNRSAEDSFAWMV